MARRPAAKAVVVLATADPVTSAIAAAAPAATSVPAAPSKWAYPSRRAGYCARTRSMSNGMPSRYADRDQSEVAVAVLLQRQHGRAAEDPVAAVEGVAPGVLVVRRL